MTPSIRIVRGYERGGINAKFCGLVPIVIEAYNELSEEAMAEIVRTLLVSKTAQVQIYLAPIGEIADDVSEKSAIPEDDNPIAKRILTGERAENIFLESFPTLEMFRQMRPGRYTEIGHRLRFSGDVSSVVFRD